MSTTSQPGTPQGDDSGCCEGLGPATPREVVNAPGLSSISYRVGRHADFKASLLAALSRSDHPRLRALSTRSDDDFLIALLDAWAMASDVLTFYQERIANESYRLTASERRSIFELARLIGYRPSAGVAASVDLAFSLDAFPNQPPIRSPLAAGLKVQSVPDPGQQAQIFETVEAIEARSEWSAIRPLLSQPQVLSPDMTSATVAGTATRVKPGDTILIVSAVTAKGEVTPRQVLAVTTDEQTGTTRFDLMPSPVLPPFVRPTDALSLIGEAFPQPGKIDESAVAAIRGRSWLAADLVALADTQGWSQEDLTTAVRRALASPPLANPTGIFALRRRAAIFGHNVPQHDAPDFPAVNWTVSWPDPTIEYDAESRASAQQRSVFLDSVYPSVVPDSWIVLTSPSLDGGTADPQPYVVKANQEITKVQYDVSDKVSRLRVAAPDAFPARFTMRTTTVLIESEELPIAPAAIAEDVSGDIITLSNFYLGLRTGGSVAITGIRSDLPGTTGREVRKLAEVRVERGYTVLELDQPLEFTYVRSTVTINANVAPATHGETRNEVLGSGDASRPFQRFTLRQPPLTCVGSDDPSGARSTLQVYVNEVLWHEVPELYGCGPDDRVYATLTDDTGTTTVQFGDGRIGARLPTGQNNVRATYRRGTGSAGLLRAGQLSMPMTRPLGLSGATNPLPPSGASDPESLADARTNAPLRAITLDRIVSLRDYEDFARAFGGVAKALATETAGRHGRGVFVTVAGPSGAEIKDKLFSNLRQALVQYGDPHVRVTLASYRKAYFQLDATLIYDPDHVAEAVRTEVEAALRDAFSFERRSFGQPVLLSEVMAVVQAVEGVVAVDVNELYRTDRPPVNHPETSLPAAAPELGSSTPLAAELLTLDPAPPHKPRMPPRPAPRAAELLTLDPAQISLR